MKKLLTLAAAALLASSVANADYYVVGKGIVTESGTQIGDWSNGNSNGLMTQSSLNTKTYYFKGQSIGNEWKIFYGQTWNYGYKFDTNKLNSVSSEANQNDEGNTNFAVDRNPFIVFYESGYNKGKVLVGQWEDVTFKKDGSYYLVFDNTTAKWPAVNAYEYNADNTSFAISTWPGKTMTRQIIDGTEYWVLKIASDKNVNNIKLFNPFNENNCIELKNVDTEKLKSAVVLNEKGMTNTYKLEYSGSTEEPGETVLPTWTAESGKKYVFYDNSLTNWEKVGVYTYGEELNGKWPGQDATLMDVDGHELWVYAFDSNATINHLIFNNGYDDSNDQKPYKIQMETIDSDFCDTVYQGGATVNNQKVSSTAIANIVKGKYVAIGSEDPDPTPADEEQKECDHSSDINKSKYIDASELGITDPNNYYLIFDNSEKKWSDVHCHAWNDSGDLLGDGQTTGWPGKTMTEVEGTNYYYVAIPYGTVLKGFIFNGKDSNNNSNQFNIENVDFDLRRYPIYKDKNNDPEAYLVFPSEVTVTNPNIDGCFTLQNGIIHHDNHVAVHPNEKNAKSVELQVAAAVEGNAFDFLANDELNDHFFVSFKPLFDTSKFTFINGYEQGESGEWHPVYKDESAYKCPRFGYFEYEEDDRTFYSHINTAIAGDYEVTVKLDDYAYTCSLIPFKKTFKVNIKPTLESLGLHFAAKIGDTDYVGGYGIDEKNGNVLKTNLTKFSDEAIKKVDIKTGNHVPTRTLNIWYKLVSKGSPAPRKAAATDGDLEGYKLVTGLLDLTDVKNNNKTLSLVVEQNGSTTGNIDFSGDANNIVTAVEGVEVEGVEAPARYFTLQGVEVSNLVPGIYIMVKGNVSSKILVK